MDAHATEKAYYSSLRQKKDEVDFYPVCAEATGAYWISFKDGKLISLLSNYRK